MLPLKAAQLSELGRPPSYLAACGEELGCPAGGGEHGTGQEVRVQQRGDTRVLEAKQREEVQVLVH